MAATIETIAELGYGQASFARIAERAGLSSTRLISYHFSGKSELIQAVLAQVYAEMADHMAEQMQDVRGPRDALLTYIRALVAFIADHPIQMRALMSVFLDYRAEDGGRSYGGDDERQAVAPLQDILRAGQATGEFRDFDVFVVASTIQRAIDGLPFLLQTAPDLDLAAYAEELVAMFDLATRNAP
ncbi:TetR/AcrR family transcriptional regulator [Streptomyces sp. IMTB 2501]|uniref:TetR/AcrR family transcriptional regulator n=1 Tax=Streptomyces sp. IMTB 2501 TaxID=1776340 RepID=UPI0009A17F78|nr:TetR/AcrR family transcriptional regulator [Streptomyces sp. IMTB 2501]